MIGKNARKELRKLDPHQALLITQWLYTNIDGIDDPYSKGKGLTADKSGLWRYRVGNYRIICDINDNEFVVLAVAVGHRKDIYKR